MKVENLQVLFYFEISNIQRKTMIKNHLQHFQHCSPIQQNIIGCYERTEDSQYNEVGEKKTQEQQNNLSTIKNQSRQYERLKDEERKQKYEKRQYSLKSHKRGKVKVFGSKCSIPSYVISINETENECLFLQPKLNNRSISESKNQKIYNTSSLHNFKQKSTNENSVLELFHENSSNISNAKSQKQKKKIFASRRPILPSIVIVNPSSSLDSKRQTYSEYSKKHCNINQFKKQRKIINIKKSNERPKLIGNQKKIKARIDVIELSEEIKQLKNQIFLSNSRRQRISQKEQQQQQSQYLQRQINIHKQQEEKERNKQNIYPENQPKKQNKITEQKQKQINGELVNNNKQTFQQQQKQNFGIELLDLQSSDFDKIEQILSNQSSLESKCSSKKQSKGIHKNNQKYGISRSVHSQKTTSSGQQLFVKIIEIQQKKITKEHLQNTENGRIQSNVKIAIKPLEQKNGESIPKVETEESQSQVYDKNSQQKNGNQIKSNHIVQSIKQVHHDIRQGNKQQVNKKNQKQCPSQNQKEETQISSINSTNNDIRRSNKNSLQTSNKYEIAQNQQVENMNKVNLGNFTKELKQNNNTKHKISISNEKEEFHYDYIGASQKYGALQTQIKKNNIDVSSREYQNKSVIKSIKNEQQHSNNQKTSSNNSIKGYSTKTKQKQNEVNYQTIKIKSRQHQHELKEQQQNKKKKISQQQYIQCNAINQQKKKQQKINQMLGKNLNQFSEEKQIQFWKNNFKIINENQTYQQISNEESSINQNISGMNNFIVKQNKPENKQQQPLLSSLLNNTINNEHSEKKSDNNNKQIQYNEPTLSNRYSEEESELTYYVRQQISRRRQKSRVQQNEQPKEKYSLNKIPEILINPKSQDDKSIKQDLTYRINQQEEKQIKKNLLPKNSQSYKQLIVDEWRKLSPQFDIRILKQNINENKIDQKNKQKKSPQIEKLSIDLFENEKIENNEFKEKQMTYFIQRSSKELKSDCSIQKSSCFNIQSQKQSIKGVFRVSPLYKMNNKTGLKNFLGGQSNVDKILTVSQQAKNNNYYLQKNFGKQLHNQKAQNKQIKSIVKKKIRCCKFNQGNLIKKQNDQKKEKSVQLKLSSLHERTKFSQSLDELQEESKKDKDNVVQDTSKRYLSQMKNKKQEKKQITKKHSPYLSPVFIIYENQAKNIFVEKNNSKASQKTKVKHSDASFMEENHQRLMKQKSDKKKSVFSYKLENSYEKLRFIYLQQPIDQEKSEQFQRKLKISRFYKQNDGTESRLQECHWRRHPYLRAHSHQFSYLYSSAQLEQAREKLNDQLKQLEKKLIKNNERKTKTKNRDTHHFYFVEVNKQTESEHSSNQV